MGGVGMEGKQKSKQLASHWTQKMESVERMGAERGWLNLECSCRFSVSKQKQKI